MGGNGLALDRFDHGVHGRHDLVVREAWTRIIQRILDRGGDRSCVCRCPMVDSQGFDTAGVAVPHIFHVAAKSV